MGFRLFAVFLWLGAVICLCSLAGLALTGHVPPMIGDLIFSKHPAERTIATIIFGVLGWTLVELAARVPSLLREQGSIAALLKLQHDQQAQITPEIVDKIKGRRAQTRVHQIAIASQTTQQQLRELLPNIAAVDANQLVYKYGALHVYAWILPVLGFIGTAIGMAIAIEGFQGPLEEFSKDQDATTISTQLANTVIPGLAAAFKTTILALAASMVVYVCASALRDWDHRLLNELDYLSLAYLPLPPETALAAIGDDIRMKINSQDDLAKAVAALDKTADALTSVMSKLDAFGSAPAALANATKSVENAAEQLAQASRDLSDASKMPIVATFSRGNGVEK